MDEYIYYTKVYDHEETYEYEHGNLLHAVEHYHEELAKGNKVVLLRYKNKTLERYNERTNTWG